jgi:hypothetical protein
MGKKEKNKTKLKVSVNEAFKLIFQYSRKRLIEQIKAVAMIIIYLIFFQTIILGIPLADSAFIAAGLSLVIVGLTFFMEGLLLGLMPLGEICGVKLPQKSKLPVILVFAFILGLGATFAEPAIGVLRAAGASVTAWASPLLFLLLNKYANYLVYSVGIGVGIAVIFGMLRFLYGWSLKPFIYILVSLLTGISLYAHFNPNLRFLLGLAWDCGAVTTGPVTVPLVLALGIGISRIAGGSSSDGGGGFGVVTLASLFPIIAVLTIGIVNVNKVSEPMAAVDFFSSQNSEKALFLFEDTEDMRGYALKNADYQSQLKLFDDNVDKMTEYLQKIKEDDNLLSKTFETNEDFEKWAVTKGNNVQRLVVFETQDKVNNAIKKFAEQRGVSTFDAGDFFSRNAMAAFQAIIPLSLFLMLVLFFILREKLPQADEIILGLFFALLGMAIFNGGIEIGLSKIGDQVGGNLPASFAVVELPSEQQTITNFNPELVNTAIMPDGMAKRFFYIYHNNDYMAVPFSEENYQKKYNQYNYTPTRGPLFGGKERSFIGLFVVLIFAFIMGYGATLAEPALNALGITVEEITVGTFKKSLLMQAVAIGVGVGITSGIVKIIWNLPLFWMLAPPYILLLIITKLSTEEFVNIGWDSAGVTTGPITVPLVLAMGLGIGSQVGVVEGFGILSMASVCPILSVLIVGLFVNMKRKAILKETMQELNENKKGGKAA